MLNDKHLFNKVQFYSTKDRKKKLCVDNINTIGDVYCPTCRNEKCAYISTNETTDFYDRKKCKACCNVLNIPFKDQKPTVFCLAVMEHIVLHERRVVTTKNHLLF